MGKKEKTAEEKNSPHRFIVLFSVLLILAIVGRSFINSESVPTEEGYVSEESGILYDYSPSKLKAALESGKPTVLDFSADWCPPCRITAPILEKLREEYAGEVTILTANADKERELVLRFKEEWFPAFIFFNRDGNEVRRVTGLIFEEDFRLAIDELIHDDSGSIIVSTISPEDVYTRLISGERLNILDVRTPGEYNSGHLPGALSMPLSTIRENQDIGLKLDSEIIVYCQGGIRSRSAVRLLTFMGYKNVKDMGGILGWDRIGGPIVNN